MSLLSTSAELASLLSASCLRQFLRPSLCSTGRRSLPAHVSVSAVICEFCCDSVTARGSRLATSAELWERRRYIDSMMCPVPSHGMTSAACWKRWSEGRFGDVQSGPSSHRAAGLWLATALPLTAERAVSAMGFERGNKGFKTRRERGA
jgi:uncharacterized protein (DUF2237 family)